MPPSPVVRLVQRPGLLGALLFLATMGLAAALAYQAARAASSHRVAAEASLERHATIAAWRFSREGRGWVGYGMNEGGNLLLQATGGDVLPGPDLLLRVLAEKECDCMSAGFSRTVFRVTTGADPRLDLLGEPLSERARDSLLAIAVTAAADTVSGQGPRQWLILPPGEPRLNRSTDIVLLWKVGDRRRGVRAIYGMVVEPAQIARPLLGALGDVQFFPPSLVQARSDSFVRIEVSGPNRQPIFASGPETRLYMGKDTLGRVFGDLTVFASIDPTAARWLVAGGLPASKDRTIVALLGLTLAMGGGALLLLRREQRLARLREDFVSSVSHELRTPLTQIRVLSELLESDGFKTGAEKTRAVTVIHREALRLTNLVDNVLEFARLRRPVKAAPQAPVSLSHVARELSESFAPLLEARGNRLELNLEEEIEIPGDRDAISRVLRNLLENAVKYGPQGQTIRLTLRRAETDGATHVMVDDQGPGIPRDERTRIWQPYYRLDRDRNASGGGSGLGLSVVADLMRLLGGRAWVGDAPGGGARFTVEFIGAASQASARP